LMECTVEINTGVCDTVADARADLESAIAALAPHCAEAGVALMCSGTHPFSHWVDQVISPDPRYGRLVETMQWPARQLQIFGIHVHVGVRSGERAVAMAGALAYYIPHFLALSASSPFWLGQDSGLASCRSKIFEQLPTAGLPYPLRTWSDFEGFMTTLINARAVDSIREVWWDVRPHPDFGTVEMRICDGMPTLSEVCAVAALSQCLVEWMDSLCDRGFALPQPKQWIVRENKWRAVRYGVDAEIIIDEEGNLVKVREAIATLVEDLSPIAQRLGCLPELQHCLTILQTGPSYLRQRDVAAAAGSLVDVVDALVQELATDTPIPAPR
ncbi:MAG: glutamate--cysteine ligase, partial [Actinomycetota bacterium]